MKLEFVNNVTQGKIMMMVNDPQLRGNGLSNRQPEPGNTLVINRSRKPQQVTVDEINYTMPGHSLLPLVYNQHFVFEQPETLLAWQFNREFYCIVDHDAEVSCVGFLFYGIHHPMFIHLTAADLESINTLEQLFREDMQLKDRMQGEMLRTLLKRLIIKSTRMAKEQVNTCGNLTDDKLDVIRQFNLLLEIHFRQEHEVSFYAKALHKSPKTLTNLFHLCGHPAPSTLIHRRIILEAKRYLYYTGKTGKEIGHELGFESLAHFSRYFKLKTGSNLSQFRRIMGKE